MDAGGMNIGVLELLILGAGGVLVLGAVIVIVLALTSWRRKDDD
ncbi:MAG: hypothetical protein KatS3mg105_2883 [Gemmatales bacterium]|nr:MAG: hypothetical protein KatS3mg105_2883 [Gemmatales bacterium]